MMIIMSFSVAGSQMYLSLNPRENAAIRVKYNVAEIII
jgi:hypothetical protein